MKKILLGVLLVSLVLALFIAPTMAKTIVIEVHGGPVFFQGTSSFFDIYFRLFNGFGNIQANGPEITDDFSFASPGSIEGNYYIDANNLRREISFFDSGEMEASTFTSDTATLVTFTGSGWLEEQINVGDGFKGLTGIYIYFDADYTFFWIKDDSPEPRPRLRLVSASTDGNKIAICVKNTGDANLSGKATVIAGLSYQAHYWVAESWTDFARLSLGNGFLAPGEMFTFIFTLPKVSEKAFTSFNNRRGLFTSDDYAYPDPSEDCIGITLSIGRKKVFAFLPLNYKSSLGIVSMSSEEGQILLTVKNDGIFYLAGDAVLTASLSLEADSSTEDSWVEFSEQSLGNGVLAPGDIITFRFQLPEIPAWVLEELENQGSGQRYLQIRLILGNRAVFVTIPFGIGQ